MLEKHRIREGVDERAVLINPPIDLAYAAGRIDALIEEADGWSKGQKERVVSYAFGAVMSA